MSFDVNSPILFVMVGIIIAVVMAQSVFFLVRAWRRAKAIGMDPQKLKKIARTAVIFTIAPAIAILVGVITLSKALGTPIPWLRLSVIGSLSYETIAATNTLQAMGLSLGSSDLTASQFVSVLFVMTISILVGIWLAPVVGRKLQKGMSNLEKKDARWSDTIINAMFIGMISAFLGFVFCDVTNITATNKSGLIPVLVMLVSAVVMAIAGIFAKKFHWRWIADYALPLSLVIGMACAIPFTNWLSAAV